MIAIEDVVLLPMPRRVVSVAGVYRLTGNGHIVCASDAQSLLPIVRRIQHILEETQRLRWTVWAGDLDDVTCRLRLAIVEGRKVSAQGYRLEIGANGIVLTGGDLPGVFYGAMTLIQILRQCNGMLPACVIEDWPDLPVRGVLLDVSRDKVPKMETLFAWVDRLAEWKINHIELYMEHTFAYRNHPDAWGEASPFTGEEILALDAFCRARFIDLVPCQNSFAHLRKWLDRPRYRPLAEAPDGYGLSRGRWSPYTFSLHPGDPKSLDLLGDWYADLLPHFSSRFLNVCGDEAFDLGQGKSKAACEEKGRGWVYLDFILKIYELTRQHGRTMLMAGDEILKYPELLVDLPKDVIVFPWGYDADTPFDEQCGLLADAGVSFYVMPGTSSWYSIGGRTDTCIANQRLAAAHVLKHGGGGYVNSDWGDKGHWQAPSVSELGWISGAALSWCLASNRDGDWVSALNVHAFQDRAGVIGKVAWDLGMACAEVGQTVRGGSVLFWLLQQDLDDGLPDGVTVEDLTRTAAFVQEAVEPLGRARLDREDGHLVCDEFANTARLLLHACDRGISHLNGTQDTAAMRQKLAEDMRVIIGAYQQLWVARNRIGGLLDSAARFKHLEAAYLGTE